MSYLTDTKELLPKARALIIEHQRGSISLVQRHLRIGYNAASELLEALEAEGVVGPVGSEGEYGQKVLVPKGENPPMAKTTAERQEAYRARRAMLEGAKEVRGIYLPEPLHAELKEYAKNLAARARKTEQSGEKS